MGSWSSEGSSAAASSHAGEAIIPSWVVKYVGTAVLGPRALIRTVRSSTFSNGVSGSNVGRKTSPISGSASWALSVLRTASASMTSPSVKTMPSRSFMSHEVKSSLGVQLSDMLLAHWSFSSHTVSVSKMAWPIITPETARPVLVGFRDWGSASSPMRSTPPDCFSTPSSVTSSSPVAVSSAPAPVSLPESSPESPPLSPLSAAEEESSPAELEPSSSPPPQAEATKASTSSAASSRERFEVTVCSPPFAVPAPIS